MNVQNSLVNPKNDLTAWKIRQIFVDMVPSNINQRQMLVWTDVYIYKQVCTWSRIRPYGVLVYFCKMCNYIKYFESK